MRKFLSYLSLITLFILGIFLLEGACFRLVENYAQFRLQLAWGEKERDPFMKYLENYLLITSSCPHHLL